MSSKTPTDPENTIAYMGIEGSNSDLASRQAHPYMQTLACASFEDVFEAVESGQARLGMIPIENSQAGRVAEIHHILPKTKLHIVGEFIQKIEHVLLAPKSATLETIKDVYSHPQALMQSRESIRKLGLKAHPYSNTASAAMDVAKWNDPTKAAIASPLAGEIYQLKALKTHFEDAPDNSSVFIVLAKEPVDPEARAGEKVLTSVLFTVRNIPAALYKALGGFATGGINMIKLESYIPTLGGNESAQFFITFEGHPHARNAQLALEELSFYCKKVSVLGVYLADAKRS